MSYLFLHLLWSKLLCASWWSTESGHVSDWHDVGSTWNQVTGVTYIIITGCSWINVVLRPLIYSGICSILWKRHDLLEFMTWLVNDGFGVWFKYDIGGDRLLVIGQRLCNFSWIRGWKIIICSAFTEIGQIATALAFVLVFAMKLWERTLFDDSICLHTNVLSQRPTCAFI